MSELELSELQIALVKALWQLGEGTVGEVQASLDRDLAPTTVATLLRRLEKRGVVEHRREGRQFVYRARVTEEKLTRSMVGGLLDRLFRGRPSDMVCHLLEDGDLDSSELDRVKKLIAERERDLDGGAGK